MSGATLPTALDRLARSRRGTVVGPPGAEVRLDHAELWRRAAVASGGFSHQGVRLGERVIVRLSSSLDDLVTLLGLIHLGAVPVSVKPGVPGTEGDAYIAEVARQQGARRAHGVAHDDLDTLEIAATGTTEPSTDTPAPEDTAFVQYTSGSTGSPRPVPLAHRALLADIRAIGSLASPGPDRTGFVVVPLHHDMGLIGMLSCLVNDLGLYLVDPFDFLRRPVPCLELAAELGASETAMPNFLLEFLTRRLVGGRVPGSCRDHLFSSWDTVYCGAEAIRRATVRDFVDAAQPFGLKPSCLMFCYGLAEATLLVSAHRYLNQDASFDAGRTGTPACLGRPVEGVEIRIDDADHREVADGVVGTVRLRGDVLFSGYDGATDHRDVWFDTGDLGYLRNGDLYLSGRRTDRIIVNGENLFVSDIEAHVRRRHALRDCVVLPDADSFTVLLVPERSGGVDKVAVATDVTTAFAVKPVSVVEVPLVSIHRTASGKIARNSMLEEFRRGSLK